MKKSGNTGNANLRRMNLQFFAEAAEAEAVEATPSADVTSEPTDKVDKAFAARLGHEKTKLESQYTPYKSVIEAQAKQANMSVEEYLKFEQKQREEESLDLEAEKSGKTPEQVRVEREKAEVEGRLAQYEHKEKLSAEERELTSDPVIGSFVKDNIDKIRELAESTGTSLKTCLAVVAAEKLPELIAQTKPEVHINKYLKELREGKTPIEIGGTVSSPAASRVNSFDAAKKSASERLNT